MVEAIEEAGFDSGEHRSRVGEVAEVVLVGGESCQDLSFDPEGGQVVGEALHGSRDHLEDRGAQTLECLPVRLAETGEVVIDEGSSRRNPTEDPVGTRNTVCRTLWSPVTYPEAATISPWDR